MRKMKVVCVIAARMASTRLPKKVMKEISGKPMIEHVIRRIQRSKLIDGIVVATTSSKNDDEIADFMKKLGINCYRGSMTNVLGRMLNAAKSVNADILVRMTSDRPFADPKIIDSVIKLFLDKKPDLASNTTLMQPFPIGLDVEVCSVRTLERIDKLTSNIEDREHVTLYFYRHPNYFEIAYLTPQEELNCPGLRLTVDTYEDLSFAREIYKRLYKNNTYFSAKDIIKLLDKEPELIKINAHIEQVHPL